MTSRPNVQGGANSHVSNVSRRAGQDLAWAAAPDRGRNGSVRQSRARQDKIEPGWVDHGRIIGSVGRNWAGSCKADHGRAVSGRTAPGRVKQSSTSQHQARPRRTGQGDKRSVSVE